MSKTASGFTTLLLAAVVPPPFDLEQEEERLDTHVAMSMGVLTAAESTSTPEEPKNEAIERENGKTADD